MMNKVVVFIIFFFFSHNLFSQDDYILLLSEIDSYVTDNFVSPFRTKNVMFLNDNYTGFGYKKNPFSGTVWFSYSGYIFCNNYEHIYSMADGIILEIGYNDTGRFVLIKHNEIEVYYFNVSPMNINEGDTIEKGQLIGRINPPYINHHPALLLKIKYKNYFFDPYFLLEYIILHREDLNL